MKLQIPGILALFLWGCTPLSQSSVNSGSNPKVLKFIDQAYEPQVRTIMLHSNSVALQTGLQPAITSVEQQNLMLEFDDLNSNREIYYAKIIHCNYDWTKSVLMDLDFLDVYNEFTINNYEYSMDSHIPYNHYWFNVPQVKIPGNYLLIVYRGGNKEDLILSKRFMVYDTRVNFVNERNLVGAGSVASLNQQFNFTINYKNMEVINPLDNFKVVIRQNQRWDNLASDVRPSFVREVEKEIEYRFFDEKKMFKGGNEFRYFDLRSLISPGWNVATVNKTTKPFEAFIQRDKPKTNEAYSQLKDLNGGFILDNYDYREASFSNYVYVNFTLASRPLPGDVYVTGAFNYWNLDDENLMYYDSAAKEYQGRTLLKQGRYDYQYIVKSDELPPYYIEGSHFETENSYEVFVYYRPFNPKADLLIGYVRFLQNGR
jgi:hypothetical protein